MIRDGGRGADTRSRRKLFTGGEAEVTLRWTDEATGLRCKGGRITTNDAARELVLASDLKSTL